jgi:tRNA pseudouridine55 synthase
MGQRSGFIVLDKPVGISSAQAIARVKNKLKIEKIGHAGTLDPFATGLLVVLVNRATRLASRAMGGHKHYKAIFRFGVATDSDDKTGAITALSNKLPTRAEIEDLLPEFTGTILQRPPRISAIKIKGKPAYKRARSNEDFEIASRQVLISELSVLSYQAPDLELSIRCGSGTYIRSLARDIGARLATFGTVMTLRRELSEPFSIQAAVSLDDCCWDSLIGWDNAFPKAPRLVISESQAQLLAGGDQRVISVLLGQGLPAIAKEGEHYIFALAANNASLGVLEYTSGAWKLSGYFGE